MRQFITDMLNIQEEQIEDVQSIKQSDGSIVVHLKLKIVSKICPYCSRNVKVHGYYPRKLIHSTLANRKCTIIYKQRRFYCSNCDLSFNEHNPFGNTTDCLTYETKVNILNDLKHPESTYTNVANRYNVSKATVLRLFDKHVDIPRKPFPEVLSLDEHYFPESDFISLYCFLMMDFNTGEIIDVLPDRKKNYLLRYFTSIRADTRDSSTSRSELDNVKYISIDLYDNYRDIAHICFPRAVICADSFHVLKHLTEDFNRVRLKCLRKTDNRVSEYLLVKFRFVFDHGQYLDNEPKYNKTVGRYVNYRTIRDMMFENFPELEAAYNLKELYISFNQNATLETAPEQIEEMIGRFADSGIKEYNEFYGLLRNWKEEIINSFTRFNGRRINNSYIESKNRILER